MFLYFGLLLMLPSAAWAASADLSDLLAPILAVTADLERRVELVDEPLQPKEVIEALRAPAAGLEFSLRLGETLLRKDRLELLREAGVRLELKVKPAMVPAAKEIPEGMPSALAGLLGRFEVGADRSQTSDELADFFITQLTNGTPSAKRLRKGESWLERDLALLELAQSFELEAALRSGDGLFRTAVAAMDELTALSSTTWPAEAVTFDVKGILIRIGSLGDDRHHGDFDLLVDPGGDDDYRFGLRMGSSTVVLDLAGNDLYRSEGYGGPASAVFGSSILIDASGDDVYLGADGAQASALFGTAVLWDRAGNDIYSARSFSQGAASFGAALLIDDAGSDVYRASYLSQGMGYVRGVGLIRDARGNDLYTSGFSEPDPRGYYEKYGGKKQGEVFQSLSQGFGMGWRSFAGGGFGFLLDARGNDRYVADYFGQGGGYWFGRGLLMDASGNDSYIARRYAQGSGVHFAVGELIDLDGNDRYQSWAVSQGTGHDYGVGSLFDADGEDVYAGDWSVMGMSNAQGVGLFRDQGGADRYAFWDHAGAVSYWDDLRHGAGLGVFADTGDRSDRFSVERSTRIWSTSPWSVAIAGKVSTSWTLTPDGTFDKDDGQGAYRDADVKEAAFLADRLNHAQSLGDRTRISELLFVTSGWGINSTIPTQAKLALLREPPDRALPVLLEFLRPRSLFATMMLEEYFHGAPGVRPALRARAGDDDPKTRSQALYLLGKLRDAKAAPIFIARLNDENWRVRKQAARSLGHLYDRKVRSTLADLRGAIGKKDHKAVSALLAKHKKTDLLWLVGKSTKLKREDWAAVSSGWERWTASKPIADAAAKILIRDEVYPLDLEPEVRFQKGKALQALEKAVSDAHPEVRRWAVWSLHQLRSDPAVVVGALYDPDHGVREAAAKALSERGTQSIEPLKRVLKKARGRSRAQIVRALAGVNDASLQRLFDRETRDDNAQVRFEALKALVIGQTAGRWTISRSVIKQLAKDSDRWVKSLALSIQK
ncbi:MAG: hypothetical protein COB53_03830 [Elusimicrobia bacterium]|nr:MAG: hypothetical protein COB53_03830 [Elusimicrobiota bacterium]